ncbi:type 1 glutamine amidotransferase [uncultured Aquitalea sp.]|uniref:type 1 glutamine amidotransferase n=1 Tax=uncultured Aquitalea sp. TaxID=540272 RepID=UPI0025DDEA16|nr:type 1 glutamine amidotransferase [uncultured Aquitalea sp.]
MKPIAIIQHVSLDGPEFFLDCLNEQGIPSVVFHVYADDPLPPDVSAFSGIASFGGPMSVNDADVHWWISPEIALLAEAVRMRVPVIGHCLGGQLLAKALGAVVRKTEVPEIGWTDLQACDQNIAAEWFGGRRSIRMFEWHSDTFEMPEGARLLLSSAWCARQAFEYDGIHLGMQFHSEVKAPMIRQWLKVGYQDIEAHDVPSVMSAAAIDASLDAGMPASHAVARDIYARWLQGVMWRQVGQVAQATA